jgi:hypothetical protein
VDVRGLQEWFITLLLTANVSLIIKKEYYLEGAKKEIFIIDIIDKYIYEKQPEYPLSNIYLFNDNFNLEEEVNKIGLENHKLN